MDAGDTLPEHRHDERIGGVDAGELHVVRHHVRRNAMRHELAH